MLKKSPSNFNVEKLRIILLFEADFNSNNKWLGCAVMLNTEQFNLLAPEQYGSRKKKSAIAQCLNKLLFYDIICFRWQPAALCSNNAKSCYGRIVLLVVALCLCRLGASHLSVFSMISTLHQMEHSICTMFGDSKKAGSHKNWGKPIAGIGQGNGAGPQIWAAVSSPLFELLQSAGFFANIVGAISQLSRKLSSFAFVDDTDLCITHPSNNIEQVAKHMQSSVSTWEGLLRATGGALVPDKCFWYLIDFKHNNGKWRYRSRDQIPGSLFVHNDKGQQTQIPHLEVSEAQCTLGVRIALDGNSSTKLSYLVSVATEWHDKMARSWLSQHKATFSLHQVIFRKLQYSLLATTFSPKQCKSIMVPILK